MGPSTNVCDHAPAGNVEASAMKAAASNMQRSLFPGGINAGDGKRSLMLPMSSTGAIGNFSETLIADSNVGIAGTWMFRVDRKNGPSDDCSNNGI